MISPAIVRDNDGSIMKVKNLGWLLRNWQRIDQFCLTNPREDGEEFYLIVYMLDGRTYETGFADLGIFQRWVKRPVFIGCKISSTLRGHEYTVREVTRR